MKLKRSKNETNFGVRHLAIIMDGNRRWARAKGLPYWEGHRRGLLRLKEIVSACVRKRIRYLTVFAWSTENWKRSEGEQNRVFDFFAHFFDEKYQEAKRENVKVNIFGKLVRFPTKVQKRIEKAVAETKKNSGLNFNVCLDYGGRAEIIRAVQEIVKKKIKPGEITEKTFARFLYGGNIPDPDLLIRTSGEKRISNFLLWRVAYSELYFPRVCWPDFSAARLDEALEEFSRRERRFGK